MLKVDANSKKEMNNKIDVYFRKKMNIAFYEEFTGEQIDYLINNYIKIQNPNHPFSCIIMTNEEHETILKSIGDDFNV